MAICWLFEDEWTEPALAAANHVTTHGAVVPSLWRIEVANVLRTAVRRSRCDEPFVDRSLRRLASFMIEIDNQTDVHAWEATLALARSQNLTVYDAAYLELAVRRNLPLATGDKALVAAAQRLGIPFMSP